MKKFLISILSILLLVSCSSTVNNKINKTDSIETKTTETTWNQINKNNDLWEKVIINEEISEEKQKEYEIAILYDLLNKEKYIDLEKELIKADQNDKNILKLYAKFYLTQKKSEEALEKALKADEEFKWQDSDLDFILWVIYDNKWDKLNAKKYIEKSIEIDPNFTTAIDYMKRINESEKVGATGSIIK